MARVKVGFITLVGMIMLLMSSPALAQGKCEPEILASGTSLRLIYDPLQSQGAQLGHQLPVVNSGGSACNLWASATTTTGDFKLRRDGGNELLSYSLLDVNANRELAVTRPANGKWSIHLGKDETMPLSLSFSVVSADMPRAGIYRQTVTLTLVDANGDAIRSVDLELILEVTPSALIGLKGDFQRSGSTARINLGELVPGTKPLMTTLYVQSSAGYKVTVSSANQGRLRMANTDWYVSYDLILGNQRMDLGNGDNIEVYSVRPRFDDYPLGIHIGPTAGRRAGAYSDTLTFTVASVL